MIYCGFCSHTLVWTTVKYKLTQDGQPFLKVVLDLMKSDEVVLKLCGPLYTGSA